jgi:hypothetical protein
MIDPVSRKRKTFCDLNTEVDLIVWCQGLLKIGGRKMGRQVTGVVLSGIVMTSEIEWKKNHIHTFSELNALVLLGKSIIISYHTTQETNSFLKHCNFMLLFFCLKIKSNFILHF